MALFRLAQPAPGAYVEVDATENADGSLTVSQARWQNLTSKTLTFSFRRATGVSILSRTINPSTALSTANVSGSAANRTLVTCASTLRS